MSASYPFPNRYNRRGQRLCAAATTDGRPCSQPIARPGQQVCHFHANGVPLPDAAPPITDDWLLDAIATPQVAKQAWFLQARPEAVCASAAVAAGASVAIAADPDAVQELVLQSAQANGSGHAVCVLPAYHLGTVLGHVLAPTDQVPEQLQPLLQHGGTLVLTDLESVPRSTLSTLLYSLGPGVQRDLGIDVNVVLACPDPDAWLRTLPVLTLTPHTQDKLPLAPALDTSSPAFKQAVQYHAATLMTFMAKEDVDRAARSQGLSLWGASHPVFYRLEAWGRIAAALDETVPSSVPQHDQLMASALSGALGSPILAQKYVDWKAHEGLPNYAALRCLSPPQLAGMVNHAVSTGRPNRVLWSLLAARVVAQNYDDTQRAHVDAWVDTLWRRAPDHIALGNPRALADNIARSFGVQQLQLPQATVSAAARH